MRCILAAVLGEQEDGLYFLQGELSACTASCQEPHVVDGCDLTHTPQPHQTNLPSLIFSSSSDTVFPSTGAIATDRSGPDLEVGQLDVKAFDFVDEKLGVVFESQEMVSLSRLCRVVATV